MSTHPKPIVLVLGANGRFGAAAVQAFAAAGWTVRAQARRAPTLPAGAEPVGAVPVHLPLEDTAALAAAATGACVVVFAVNPPYPQWAAHALPLLHRGIAVAQRLSATLMLPGNVYNFGEQMPPRLDSRTPHRPTTRKGRIRVQMEDALRALAQRGELRSTVIRAGDFFGGATNGWFDQLTRSLRKGRLAYPGPLDVPHAWAYLPDLAHAFAAVASRADALPAFADLPFPGHTLTGAQWLDAIERAAASLHLAPSVHWQRSGMPWPLMKLGGLVVPMLREIVEMEYLWRVPHALDGSALEAAVGPVPITPIDAAMRQALIARGLGCGATDTGPQPASA